MAWKNLRTDSPRLRGYRFCNYHDTLRRRCGQSFHSKSIPAELDEESDGSDPGLTYTVERYLSEGVQRGHRRGGSAGWLVSRAEHGGDRHRDSRGAAASTNVYRLEKRSVLAARQSNGDDWHFRCVVPETGAWIIRV